MHTFPQLIPNVEDLLALHPEELAEYVLKLANRHQQNGIVHQQTMQSLVQPHPAMGAPGYAANRQGPALQAIAEAWNWLLRNGLLVPDYGPNGSKGFVRVSRAGARLLAS